MCTNAPVAGEFWGLNPSKNKIGSVMSLGVASDRYVSDNASRSGSSQPRETRFSSYDRVGELYLSWNQKKFLEWCICPGESEIVLFYLSHVDLRKSLWGRY